MKSYTPIVPYGPTCATSSRQTNSRQRRAETSRILRSMVGSPGAHNNSLVGELLGKDYLVLEQIGRGGMAVVYLVEHQTLQKRFAAKVLSPDHASSAEARARFTQEAHAASQLDHENIVTISDFGITADARPFFVMELLRGQTLDVRLEEGPMTIEEVVAVAVPVARALAHAHAEGIIHRDIKPENVFLVQRSQGRWGVKVLDFGIAKVPVNQHLTAMGQTLGSPMFMSPEACRGEDVDQRADIYSFGILLYLMLSGRVPFQDESLLKILQMQVTAPLPSPREFNPDISPELEAVIVRALAKNADERYATMEELLVDLEAALPEGSDSLLILAQFGTSALRNTPFPGSLDRVRNSQRMAQFSQSSLPATTSSTTLPAAPKSNRKTLIVVGAIGALAIAGIWGYGWWRQQQKETAPTAAVTPPPAVVAPTPTPPPPAVAVTPTPPPIETPPAPVDQPVVEPPVEPVKEPEDPQPTTTAKVTPKKQTVKTQPQPKKETPKPTTAVKVSTPPPTETAKGSAKGSGAVTVVTPPVPDKPTPPPDAPPTPVVPPKPTPVAPVVNIGSLDATPAIANLDVNGPLPSSVARRTVERAMPAIRACYRTAAKTSQKTPAVSVALTFEIDENSSIGNVSANGAKDLASLAGCVRKTLTGARTQQAPDVGTAHVSVSITFKPT